MPLLSNAMIAALPQGVCAGENGGQGRGRTADLPLFRRIAGSTESITGRLTRPDELSGLRGAHGRPQASIAVVSTVLADGFFVPKPSTGPTARVVARLTSGVISTVVCQRPCLVTTRYRLVRRFLASARRVATY